jgi:hypothetical protein
MKITQSVAAEQSSQVLFEFLSGFRSLLIPQRQISHAVDHVDGYKEFKTPASQQKQTIPVLPSKLCFFNQRQTYF